MGGGLSQGILLFASLISSRRTAEFWLNLQSLYELRVAQKNAGKSIDRLPTLKQVEEAHV
jgi:hypothetical protein